MLVGKPSDFYNEDLLYKLFGVNAELLIDHAWGWEPCKISDIKEYRPDNRSLSIGQVLSRGYKFDEARIIVKEMADDLALSLMDKSALSECIDLTICYDISSLMDYNGEIKEDFYGRPAPKNAHGSIHLGRNTNISSIIVPAAAQLYEKITDPNLLVRRIYIVATDVIGKHSKIANEQQLSIFDMAEDNSGEIKASTLSEEELKNEEKMQEAILNIQYRFGKNSIIKGLDLEESATALERHGQIGGHKA